MVTTQVPGDRHDDAGDTPNDGRGKGSWLSSYGLSPADLAGTVICVAAYKGGVGKTFLAYELAYMLGAVLVDLDWDRGGATVAWGYREEQRVNSPLLDALDTGKVPRPLDGGAWRPFLVPSSKDFGINQPSAATMSKTITRWAGHWATELQRPVVVDTGLGDYRSPESR